LNVFVVVVVVVVVVLVHSEIIKILKTKKKIFLFT